MKKFVLIFLFSLISFGCLSLTPVNTTAVETAVAFEMTQDAETKPEIPTVQVIPTFPPPISFTQKPIAEMPEEPTPVAIPSLTISVPTPIPPTITRSGLGDSVVDIPEMISGYTFIGFSNNGDENFMVESYDSAGNKADLFVNTIGIYAGWHMLPMDKVLNRFEIKSNGQWTVEVQPNISNAVTRITAPATYHGEGDSVLGVTCCAAPAPDTAEFIYPLDKNFVVFSYSKDGSKELLVDEIGPYQGTITLPQKLEFIEVKAVGGWDLNMTAK